MEMISVISEFPSVFEKECQDQKIDDAWKPCWQMLKTIWMSMRRYGNYCGIMRRRRDFCRENSLDKAGMAQ